MKLNLRIFGVILFGVIMISMISFEQAWAADETTLKELFQENPKLHVYFLGKELVLNLIPCL